MGRFLIRGCRLRRTPLTSANLTFWIWGSHGIKFSPITRIKGIYYMPDTMFHAVRTRKGKNSACL